jgi:hypothetical protein
VILGGYIKFLSAARKFHVVTPVSAQHPRLEAFMASSITTLEILSNLVFDFFCRSETEEDAAELAVTHVYNILHSGIWSCPRDLRIYLIEELAA